MPATTVTGAGQLVALRPRFPARLQFARRRRVLANRVRVPSRPGSGIGEVLMSGAALADIGLAIAAQRPLTAIVIFVTARG